MLSISDQQRSFSNLVATTEPIPNQPAKKSEPQHHATIHSPIFARLQKVGDEAGSVKAIDQIADIRK